MIKLTAHSLTKAGWFRPETMALNREERTSTATLTLPLDEESLAVGNWLQDDCEPGAGIVWRIKTIDKQYDRNTQTVTLEHMISALRDIVMFGEVTPKTITGNSGASSCTAAQAITYILGQCPDWTVGTIASAYSNVSNPYNFSSETLYDALETVSSSLADCMWEYDFNSYPFKLNVLQMSADVDSEMRMSRNISTMRVTVDRTGMYTRFYPIGRNNLKITGGYVSLNESTWGVISKIETDQSKKTAAELTAWANERLSRHAEPLITVTIAGLELSASTGESLDHFVIGRKCRVPLPEYGTTVTERVTKLAYKDKLKEPEVVTVTLANKRADVASILKQQAAGSGRGGITGAKNAEEDHAWFVDTTEKVEMVAEAVAGEATGGGANWSRVAQLTVDGSGIDARVTVAEGDIVSHETRISATENGITSLVAKTGVDSLGNNETLYSLQTQTAGDVTTLVTKTGINSLGNNETLYGKISVHSDQIALVVENVNGTDVVKSASIIAAITDNNGVLSSSIEMNADYVKVGTSNGKKAVKVYIDGEITATSAQITNLKTGTTKATLINSESFTGDYISATTSLYSPSLSIGSGTNGGSGTLYYRGNQQYSQALTLGNAGAYIAEGHFLGNSNTGLSLNHYHTIVAEEGTGNDAGKIILTLSDPVATTDTTNHITNFSIAATTTYQNGVLAARNAVKVKAFTADARTGELNDHRTFTYITDAPTPASGTSQEDTWYLAGGTSWNSNKTHVYLNYGSSTGTNYAKLEVDASDVATAANRAGRAAVTLSDPTADSKTTLDDNRTFTVSTSGRQNSSGAADNVSKTVPLHLYAGGWSSNKNTVYLKWGASGGSSGTNYAKLEVDAGTLVTNAGYAGRAAVTLNDPTWNAVSGNTPSSRTVSVTTSGRTNSSGTADNLTKSVGLYLTQGSWSSNKLTVSMRAGSTSGTVYAATEVDAGSLVTSANRTGRAAVTLTDPTWNAISGATTSNRTVSVSTSGRQNSSGTADELTKSVTLYLTQGSWSNGGLTVSMRTGSTSGTEVAKTSVTMPNPSLSFDCTDQGDPSSDANDKSITASAAHGTASLGSASQVIHMTQGGWSSGKKAVNARMTNDNGKLIARVWVEVSGISVGSQQTSSNSSAYNYDKSVTINANYAYTWLPVTICGRTFKIRIHPAT